MLTRTIERRLAGINELSPDEAVRSLGIAVTVAVLAAWAMSLAIPTYLSTNIPAWAFFFCASLAALAAARPGAFARQWSRSRLRRLSLWFRRPR
ncbi:MAG: hypothetical protein FJX57_22985 [Alphaproteobacteria bacterium]|nr:hypothetical protein [Alphaproteobacteria bacterium]